MKMYYKLSALDTVEVLRRLDALESSFEKKGYTKEQIGKIHYFRMLDAYDEMMMHNSGRFDANLWRDYIIESINALNVWRQRNAN